MKKNNLTETIDMFNTSTAIKLLKENKEYEFLVDRYIESAADLGLNMDKQYIDNNLESALPWGSLLRSDSGTKSLGVLTAEMIACYLLNVVFFYACLSKFFAELFKRDTPIKVNDREWLAYKESGDYSLKVKDTINPIFWSAYDPTIKFIPQNNSSINRVVFTFSWWQEKYARLLCEDTDFINKRLKVTVWVYTPERRSQEIVKEDVPIGDININFIKSILAECE